MTFIGYPNISARSPSGAFRLEIVGSPVEDGFRDQGNFVYRCYHVDKEIWSWCPALEAPRTAELADYPREAWISDCGWIVVRTHTWFHASLMVLSPARQIVAQRLHRRVADEPGFLDGDEDRVGNSSAGPFWAGSAIAYFWERAQRHCWTIRTWWGRRITIDLETGEFLAATALDPELAHAQELSLVKSLFATYLPSLLERGKQLRDIDSAEYWPLANHVTTAAYQAGRLESSDGIPYLRQLESCEIPGSVAYGPVGWALLHELPFRRVAKLSLLRLSQEPQWHSHYRFALHGEEGDANEIFYEFPMQVQARNPDSLQLGLNQYEVLQSLGAPDSIDSDVWEYDFVSPQPTTARIVWGESHFEDLEYPEFEQAVLANPPRIARVERIAPQWREITMRDYDIAR